MMVITAATATPTPISMMMMPTWSAQCVASSESAPYSRNAPPPDHAGDADARIEQAPPRQASTVSRRGGATLRTASVPKTRP